MQPCIPLLYIRDKKVSLIFGLVNIHSVIKRANGYIMDLKTCTKNGANLL